MDFILSPKAVAIIGASENPNKVGGRPIHYMKQCGFKGDVFPINPGRESVQGYRAYRQIADTPKLPDVAVIAVAEEGVAAEVTRCAERGVKAAIVMTSGFGELGEAGKQREAAFVATAKAAGMRLLGPNCQGVANFSTGAVMNFSTMFTDISAQDGPIGIVSQSGAASVIPYAILRESGHGVRYVVATGNDGDLGACEMARAVASDPHIKLLLVYLESIKSPEHLAEAAAIARARGAYVVVLKSGNSVKGAIAAASHTGAIVGNDAAIDAYLARHGIWRAHTVSDLVHAVPLYLQNRPVGDGRAVAMSHSGAVAVMTADLAEQSGLALADLSERTKRQLREILPEFGTPNNPLDMTGAILGNPTMFPRVLSAIGTDEQADTVIVSVPMAGEGLDSNAFAQATAEFVAEHDKPLVVAAPQASVRTSFRRHGLAAYVTDADAVRALHQYTKHRRLRDNGVVPTTAQPVVFGARGLQNEHQSLELLSDYGVPVVPNALCRNADEAVLSFREFGGVPVVVKGCASEIPHKTEHNLVHLHLASEHDVRAAADDCLVKLTRLGVTDPKVIIAKMAKGRHEFALGASVDPVLGAIVMIADGGTLAELRKDAVTLLAPFTPEQAKEACMKLRLAPLFEGYRGESALDVDSLAEAASALGDFAAAAGGTLKSVDVNPVMVMAAGQGVLAVDAVVEMN